jgi:hypothetical protein
MRQEVGRLTDSPGVLSHPMVRALLVFSAFRAVYGMGILVVTYTLATSDNAPRWLSVVFLGVSMVFSRWLFRRLKQRWPNLFGRQGDGETEADLQTTP